METIIRDFCNPDPTDPDFPFARHKDFFDGHSWASGLYPQANGKGQESSSEVRYTLYIIPCSFVYTLYFLPYLVIKRGHKEIGRASCRERV